MIVSQITTFVSIYMLDTYFKTDDRSLNIMIQTIISGLITYLIASVIYYFTSYDAIRYHVRHLFGYDQRYDYYLFCGETTMATNCYTPYMYLIRNVMND